MPETPPDTAAPCRPGFPAPSPHWALFLDFDGTLVDIAPRPQDVVVAPSLPRTLLALHDAFGGAVALVSGRPTADLDRLLAPARLPAAGQHGIEWRVTASGTLHHRGGDPSLLAPLRERFAAYAALHQGLVIEDKTWSLSVHYRAAPEREDEIVALATEHLPAGEELHVMHGKMVVEIKPSGIDKGNVLDMFLAEPPFAGRVPVFIGDDRTDEDGFAAVNRRDGVSIRVGPAPASIGASEAQWQCDSVDVLVRWLAALPAAIEIAAANGN